MRRDPPCGGCEDRWLTDGGRCHDSCERFLQWKTAREANKAARRAALKEESDVKISHKRKERLRKRTKC